MKFILMIAISISIVGSCANVPRAIIQFSERQYRLCEDAEALYWKKQPSAVGLVCWRYCKEYKLWHKHTHENCKLWATDVLDLKSEKDYLKFRNAGFVLVGQDQI